MNKRKILIFHPDINLHKTNNEYTKKIYAILSEEYDVKSFEWFIKHPFHKDIVCIYLNWIENTAGKKNIVVQKLQYWMKYAVLKMAHARKIRIVYVIHNKTPHNLAKESKLYQKATKPFMKQALNLADGIGVLCEHTEEYLKKEFGIRDLKNKIRFIPHGKYTEFACEIERYRNRYHIKENEFVLCFVGAMNQYKNVDIIIKALYQSGVIAKLILAGKCDPAYRKCLEGQIKDDSVITDFSFLSDEDMSGIMQMADAVVLPYENTSINSGIMINAFSNGTTVIGTNIEMLQDYAEELVYGYQYRTEEEHIEALAHAMQRAQADFHKGIIRKNGAKLREFVNRDNSWETVREALLEATMH